MFWQLDNLGFGNVATTKQRRSERELATLEWHNQRATIRDEVVTAYGRMEQTYESMRIAERRLGNAERGLQQDLQRIRGGVGLPVEVLDSMELLVEARTALILATADYDIAQFQLFVAIGQTPVASPSTEPATGKPAPPEVARLRRTIRSRPYSSFPFCFSSGAGDSPGRAGARVTAGNNCLASNWSACPFSVCPSSFRACPR